MPCQIDGTDLAYFPVPKAACSSIKYAILNHNEDGLADRMPGRMAGGKLVAHAHEAYPTVPYNPLRHGVKFARHRWFCVVRDPVARLLSAFANRVEYHDDLAESDPAALAASGLSRHPDLEEFVLRLDAYRAASASIDHHVAPLCDYLGRRAGRFDRIFTMGEIPELVSYVAAAGAGLSVPHRQMGGRKIEAAHFSPSLRNLLHDYYAEDYDVFGAALAGTPRRAARRA